MDDSLLVRVIDGVADLAREVERAVQVERAVRRDQVLQRFTRHVLHDDEEHAVLLFGGRDGDDVGMADGSEKAGFTQQLAEIESLPVRDLDRDLLVDPRVLCEVHGPEPAAAERTDDLVLPEYLAPE